MTTTLSYIIGLLDRRRFRKLLDDYGYEYTEDRGLLDRVFFVKAEIPEHVELSKDIYNA